MSPAICKIAFLALLGSAIATPALAADDEIIVQAPYSRKIERGPGGISTETVTAHRFVSARDLDQRYVADVRELDRRINSAARDACAEVRYRLPDINATPSDAQCRAAAVSNARTRIIYRR